MSVSKENFVKTIYIQHQSESDAKTGTLAKLLNISNAAATDMAKKLSAKGLVNYTKYKEISLTTQGSKMAINVIRKHRVWETFLHNTLNLSLHEIHREAEILEHLTTDFLIEKIYEFLGKPLTDPHGDPIPNKDGEILDSNSISLSLAEADKNYYITRLSGSDKEFFDFCQSNQLEIGARLKVNKQYNKNKMTEIEVNQTKILLYKDLTQTIYVEQLNNANKI